MPCTASPVQRSDQIKQKTPRHAYLVLAHKNPAQLNVLTTLLHSEHAVTHVHVDAKYSQIANELTPRENLHVVSRYPVVWGGFGMVRATLWLMELALQDPDCAFMHLLSGHCLPLWPEPQLRARFETLHNSVSPTRQWMDCRPFPIPGLFMEGMDRLLVHYPLEYQGRFRGKKADLIHNYKLAVMANPALHRSLEGLPAPHHGSQWFSITRQFALYVLDYVDTHPEVMTFFEHSLIPDEMFFQTVLQTSPFAIAPSRDNWRYLEAAHGGSYPLQDEELVAAWDSGCGFARKFNMRDAQPVFARALAALEARKTSPALSGRELYELVTTR